MYGDSSPGSCNLFVFQILLIVEEKHEIVVYNNAFRNDAIMPFSFLTKISVKLNHKNYVLS